MKSMAIVLMLFVTTQAFAQQSTGGQKDQQLKSAERKIAIGLAMMGIGALVVPLTAWNGHADRSTMTAGVGTMMVGSGIVWWGVTEHRRATQPQTAIGVSFGREVGVQFHRSW